MKNDGEEGWTTGEYFMSYLEYCSIVCFHLMS
jgi:hypothetical protein